MVLLLQGFGYLEVYLFICLNHLCCVLISSRLVDKYQQQWEWKIWLSPKCIKLMYCEGCCSELPVEGAKEKKA